MFERFEQDVIFDAEEYARKRYPEEACGLVIDGAFKPCNNIAEDPEENFTIDPAQYVGAARRRAVQGLIHSHTKGQNFPSKQDMAQQMAMAVPWRILVFDIQGNLRESFDFGDQVPRAPIISRQFRHGVHDCFSLVRDWYGAKGVLIPDFPRDDQWWYDDQDVLTENIETVGFYEIKFEEAREGDGLLFVVGSKVANHCGIYMGDGLILHHLYGKASKIDPISKWLQLKNKTVRWGGDEL